LVRRDASRSRRTEVSLRLRARGGRLVPANFYTPGSRPLGAPRGSAGRKPFVKAALAEARTASPIAFRLLPSAGESQPDDCNARTPSAVMSNCTMMQRSCFRRRHARIRSAPEVERPAMLSANSNTRFPVCVVTSCSPVSFPFLLDQRKRGAERSGGASVMNWTSKGRTGRAARKWREASLVESVVGNPFRLVRRVGDRFGGHAACLWPARPLAGRPPTAVLLCLRGMVYYMRRAGETMGLGKKCLTVALARL
jgi:hypothetical protein